MNPSPQAVDLIRSRVTDWTQTDQAVADALNAPAVANPVTQAPAVPKPFDFADVMGLLSDASVAAIRDTPNTTDLISKINAGDRAGVLHWVAALLKAPAKITADEAAAVNALMTATVPDPSWSAQIGWALATIGRPADPSDVAAARPGA